MKTKAPLYITIGGVEYVAIPRAEYEAVDEAPAEPMTEAEADLVNAIAADLKAARKAAGISQATLAIRLKRSQTMVAQAENGKMRVSEAYLDAVLKACGLPSTWPNVPSPVKADAQKDLVEVMVKVAKDLKDSKKIPGFTPVTIPLKVAPKRKHASSPALPRPAQRARTREREGTN